ncbi:MAG: hypothetical protein E6K86_06910 [Thaumarchaeota archaeon]|nr:MAG: hypothetical protein E6K86_06910 [Nitrososphaerota archaeon]
MHQRDVYAGEEVQPNQEGKDGSQGNQDYTQNNDLLVSSTAMRLELPLFTFDEELKKIAKVNSVRLLRL